MEHTPFHDYYISRMLEELSDKDRFVPVYASSNSKIYPFQIAAADFAIRSPYQKGAVLCDEAGLGKSHEAMLVITQKWLGGAAHPAGGGGTARVVKRLTYIFVGRPWPCRIRSVSPKPVFPLASSISSLVALLWPHFKSSCI